MGSRALATLAAGLALGCVTDHDALAKRPPAADAGAEAAVPDAAAGDGGGSAGAGGGPPRVPDTVTLVHGVVDAGPTAWCFSRAGEPPVGEPQPAAGLEYGRRWAVSLPEGLSWERDAVDVTVLAADPARLDGLDCVGAVERARELQAGAGEGGAGGAGGGGAAAGSGGVAGAPFVPQPELRAAVAARIPAGTFAAGRSTLLVAVGCIGGPGSLGEDAASACGEGFGAAQPTLSFVVTPLSTQRDPLHVGLQVVHASLASGPVDVTLRGVGESALAVASGLAVGGVAPRTPSFAAAAADLGSAAELDVQSSGTAAVLASTSWQDLLREAEIEAVSDGANYALVWLGAGHLEPGAPGARWNSPRISVVPVTAQ